MITHLHYELHINDKPVNPITTNIPILKSIPKTEMAVDQRHIKNLDDRMSGKAIVIAGGVEWLNEWLIRDEKIEKTSTIKLSMTSIYRGRYKTVPARIDKVSLFSILIGEPGQNVMAAPDDPLLDHCAGVSTLAIA